MSVPTQSEVVAHLVKHGRAYLVHKLLLRSALCLDVPLIKDYPEDRHHFMRAGVVRVAFELECRSTHKA